MRIEDQQEEFEILPADEEQQPVVAVPEREPQQPPEDAPA
jgi:hypothetical protein